MHRTLHIYAQLSYHDDVLIVGDREALKSLHNALTQVLEHPSRAFAANVCASDGEGYYVYCVDSAMCLTSPNICVGEEQFWCDVTMPYLTLEPRSGISPWSLFRSSLTDALKHNLYNDTF